jgi:methylated-DNA-[protein]-cysteine S-methyltransferase
MSPLSRLVLPSPIGSIVAVGHAGALIGVEFLDCEDRLRTLLRRRFGDVPIVDGADDRGWGAAFARYFAGDLAALSGLTLDPGGSPFQIRVWAALRTVPPGTRTTYGALAAALGNPAAGRAVGHANGSNPISIAIPCHRLVGSDGRLTGYGGGIARKEWLLAHEAANVHI